MRWKPSKTDLVLRALGILLVGASILKGYQLLTEPVANKDLWSWRPFLVLQVELELALGLWLLSGLFAKAAWLASLACFSLFSLITLYKGLTGAESCGCFGSVHVNPWITLFAIDLPAVAALGVFHPRAVWPRRILLRLRLWRRPVHALIRQYAKPWPSLPRFALTAILVLAVLGITTPILALNEPAIVTSTYEVLEPNTWIGKELPILEHIDIAEQLKKGTWLVLFYHHDCPDCQKAIPRYEQMAQDLAGNDDFLQIALIEVPPYGPGPAGKDSACVLGRLADTKEWFVTTPAAALLAQARVKSAWEAQAPDLNAILPQIAEKTKKVRTFASTSTPTQTLLREEVVALDCMTQ